MTKLTIIEKLTQPSTQRFQKNMSIEDDCEREYNSGN